MFKLARCNCSFKHMKMSKRTWFSQIHQRPKCLSHWPRAIQQSLLSSSEMILKYCWKQVPFFQIVFGPVFTKIVLTANVSASNQTEHFMVGTRKYIVHSNSFFIQAIIKMYSHLVQPKWNSQNAESAETAWVHTSFLFPQSILEYSGVFIA